MNDFEKLILLQAELRMVEFEVARRDVALSFALERSADNPGAAQDATRQLRLAQEEKGRLTREVFKAQRDLVRSHSGNYNLLCYDTMIE